MGKQSVIVCEQEPLHLREKEALANHLLTANAVVLGRRRTTKKKVTKFYALMFPIPYTVAAYNSQNKCSNEVVFCLIEKLQITHDLV